MKYASQPVLLSPTRPLAWAFDEGELRRIGRAGERSNGLAAPPRPCGLHVAWARHDHELREAQRLRYQIFVGEMGAQLQPPPGTPAGHDADGFDAHCDHLLVRADDGSGDASPVVGTYRVLRPEAARRIGGLYADREFDLAALQALRPKALELGRSCVHLEWRHGGVIMALWGALAQFMRVHRLETAIGCASVSLQDGGGLARGLWQLLRRDHLAAPRWWVQPRTGLPLAPGEHCAEQPVPALIKGYLRCGARVLGPPALDAQFGTADFPMLMQLADMPERYRRRLLG